VTAAPTSGEAALHPVRRAVPFAFLVLAVVLLVAALGTGVERLSYVARAETADGTVVGIDVRQAGGSASEVATFPIVEARPPGAAEPLRFRGDGSATTEYRVGDRVRVLYLPDPPRDPRLRGAAAVWSLPAGLLFGAVLAGGCGMLARRVLLEPVDDEPGDGA
jgi:hypothetical protein